MAPAPCGRACEAQRRKTLEHDSVNAPVLLLAPPVFGISAVFCDLQQRNWRCHWLCRLALARKIVKEFHTEADLMKTSPRQPAWNHLIPDRDFLVGPRGRRDDCFCGNAFWQFCASSAWNHPQRLHQCVAAAGLAFLLA